MCQWSAIQILSLVTWTGLSVTVVVSYTDFVFGHMDRSECDSSGQLYRFCLWSHGQVRADSL